jgi:hypothetical protein
MANSIPHRWFSFALWGLIAFLVCSRAFGADGENERLFAQRIWPLLKAKCLACHGEGKELEGHFDLRSAATVLQGGDSKQPSILIGKADESPLLRAIRRSDDEFSPMPPKENDRLTDQEIDLVKQWIAGGAAWPDERRRLELAAKSDRWAATEGIVVATSGGLSAEWDKRPYKPENLWPYQPVTKPAIPAAALPSNHPVDAFIEPKAAAMNVQLAPRAERRALIRRVTFDLTGLPPTPDEIDQFVGDPTSDQEAYRRLVDRLLASPHYGEHWARHWLDVTRYADSSGYANDFERGNAWRYRDYVVRSLNADKPYDQFVREQIAGDEIDPTNPEMLMAVGFLRMGPWELTGMEVAKVARQRFLDDVTDSVGQVFLAHPLQCARCHDHKFDPVPTRDYYSLQAAFATTQLAEREAFFLPDENTAGFDEQSYLLRRKKSFESMLEKLDEKEVEAARRWCQERGLPYIRRNQGLKQGLPEDQLPPRHIGFTVEDYGMERIARKGVERLKWELDRYEPVALSVSNGRTPDLKAVLAPQRLRANRMTDGELEQTSILAGGDPFSPVVAVKPGALSVVERYTSAAAATPKFNDVTGIEGRRTELAAWITHPQNPLTARVIVNRLWQWHFGRGLAGNSNNFGATGKKPTHPELLDWLAATFVERGWSIKSLQRLIVTSDTYCRSCDHSDYQQLAQKDPQGISYAAFVPRRLTAEEARDTQLSVSGELQTAIGGIPIRPEINLEAAMQPRQVMGTFAAAWQASPKPQQRHRRSLYVLRLRGLRDPFFEVFNDPSPENSCEARESSLVTPQVFSLFNSAASYDRALAFAARLERDADQADETIRQAFRIALGREASAAEVETCIAHWNEMTARHRELKFQTIELPRQITRQAVEENTGEPFQFHEQLEFHADFVPDLKPADVSAKTRGLAEVCLVLMNSNEFIYVY